MTTSTFLPAEHEQSDEIDVNTVDYNLSATICAPCCCITFDGSLTLDGDVFECVAEVPYL